MRRTPGSEKGENTPSPRELEVLRLICEGQSTKQIAARLNISHKTVAIHRFQLLHKAKAKNSIELFRWALKNGYVSVQ
jgi:two-component system, NarL family, response regulator DegU